MLDALLAGPDLALRCAASLRRCEKDEWCEPTWADGGAVVDLDRRRVLFFGESLNYASTGVFCGVGLINQSANIIAAIGPTAMIRLSV